MVLKHTCNPVTGDKVDAESDNLTCIIGDVGDCDFFVFADGTSLLGPLHNTERGKFLFPPRYSHDYDWGNQFFQETKKEGFPWYS